MLKAFILPAALLALLLPAMAQAEEEPTPVASAREAGVKSCMAPLKEIATYLVKDVAQHASHDLWNERSPDRRPFSSLIVKQYPDGDSHVSMIVGPDKAGQCFAEYNETAYWAKSCVVLRDEAFSKFTMHGSLNKHTTVLRNDNKTVFLYMTPQSDAGCLVTRREIFYY